MNNSEQYNYRALAALLAKFTLEAFTGKVTCQSKTSSCELYFNKGQLINAVAGSRDGEQVVYELLSWDEGILLVEAGPQTDEQTLDREEVKLIYDTVKLLQAKGSFDPALTPPLPPQPVGQTVLTPATEKKTSELITPADPVFSIETNLLLPPGERQMQLEELLQKVSFNEQLRTLASSRFTGCVYYRPDGRRPNQKLGDFGVALLHNGNLSDIISVAGHGPRQTGRQALLQLSETNFVPEIYRVEERILKAYRGLVACDKPIRDIKANQANLLNLMNSLKQARRDGVIILYLDSLKMHYFFLVEDGTRVGIFGPNFNTGQLQPLNAPLALPAADTNARMTVMVASRLTPLEASDSAAKVSLRETDNPEQNLAAVDWGSAIFGDAPQPRLKTPANEPQTDNSNPFDF
jgi:hypothetical protein